MLKSFFIFDTVSKIIFYETLMQFETVKNGSKNVFFQTMMQFETIGNG